LEASHGARYAAYRLTRVSSMAQHFLECLAAGFLQDKAPPFWAIKQWGNGGKFLAGILTVCAELLQNRLRLLAQPSAISFKIEMLELRD
jgi:hypothetical protein